MIYYTSRSLATHLGLNPPQIARDAEKGWLEPDAYYYLGDEKHPLYLESTADRYRLILLGAGRKVAS